MTLFADEGVGTDALTDGQRDDEGQVEHVECFHGRERWGTGESIFVQIFFHVAYCTDHRRPKCMQ